MLHRFHLYCHRDPSLKYHLARKGHYSDNQTSYWLYFYRFFQYKLHLFHGFPIVVHVYGVIFLFFITIIVVIIIINTIAVVVYEFIASRPGEL